MGMEGYHTVGEEVEKDITTLLSHKAVLQGVDTSGG